MKEKKQTLFNIRNVAVLSQLFSVCSNLQYLQAVLSSVQESFSLFLHVQVLMYCVLSVCQVLGLVKFCVAVNQELDQLAPHIDSATIADLR